jgi:hypothetical protein
MQRAGCRLLLFDELLHMAVEYGTNGELREAPMRRFHRSDSLQRESHLSFVSSHSVSCHSTELDVPTLTSATAYSSWFISPDV